MKRLLALLIFALFGSLAHGQAIFFGQNFTTAAATPTVVSTQQCASFGGTATCAMSVTSGNVLTAFTSTNSGSPTAVTPSGCGTWTQSGSTDASGGSLFTAPVVSTASCNVTGSGGSGIFIAVWQLSTVINTVGASATLPVAFPGSSPISGAAITTSTTNGQIILAVMQSGSTQTLAVNSPFTSDAAGVTGGLYSYSMGHYIQPTAGAITPTFSETGSLVTVFPSGTLALKP